MSNQNATGGEWAGCLHTQQKAAAGDTTPSQSLAAVRKVAPREVKAAGGRAARPGQGPWAWHTFRARDRERYATMTTGVDRAVRRDMARILGTAVLMQVGRLHSVLVERFGGCWCIALAVPMVYVACGGVVVQHNVNAETIDAEWPAVAGCGAERMVDVQELRRLTVLPYGLQVER